jgi:hypothetical protein
MLSRISDWYSRSGFWPPTLMVVIVCLVASTILGGPLGVVVRGERHVLLVAAMLIACYLIWRRDLPTTIRFVRAHPIVLAPALFFAGGMIWVVLPLMTDSASFYFALVDAQSLVILPAATLVLIAMHNRLENLKSILHITITLCSMLALLQVLIWLFLRVHPIPHEQIYAVIELIFGTKESVSIVQQPSNEGAYWRVVWISSYWLIFAMFLAPVFVRKQSALFCIQFLCGVAILASYTRGIWLGLLAGICMLCVLALLPGNLRRRPLRKRPWVISALGLVASLMFVLTVDAVDGNVQILLARMYATTDVKYPEANIQDESAIERIQQSRKLIEKWQERPFVGHGFGAYVKSHYSHDERPFLYEMLPVALLMKLGLIGFSLYLGFLLFVLARLWILSKRSTLALAVSLAYVATLIQIHTNPVFFSFTGMLIFSLLLCLWLTLEITQKDHPSPPLAAPNFDRQQ